MSEKVTITLKLDKAVYKEFKLLAVDEDKTVQELGQEAIESLLKRRKKARKVA